MRNAAALEQLIINLKHAVSIRQDLDIGGGLFAPHEIKAALEELEALRTPTHYVYIGDILDAAYVELLPPDVRKHDITPVVIHNQKE